jgi:heme oxygenase
LEILLNDPVLGLSSLRQATQDIHAAFESELKVAMPAAGKQDYQMFIEAMWGWLSPFENALWQAEWPDEMQAAERNGKSAWLLSDLRSAGLCDDDIASIPLAPCELDLQTQASRYGIAYVLEGAQLGSQVLSKRLTPALRPWPACWLAGYGDDVSRNWRSFMQSTETFLNNEQSSRIAAQSARQTFASLQSWFHLRGAA